MPSSPVYAPYTDDIVDERVGRWVELVEYGCWARLTMVDLDTLCIDHLHMTTDGGIPDKSPAPVESMEPEFAELVNNIFGTSFEANTEEM